MTKIAGFMSSFISRARTSLQEAAAAVVIYFRDRRFRLRALIVVLTMVCGATLGYVSTLVGADNLTPSPGGTRIGGIGQMWGLALPPGVNTKSEIRQFIISGHAADDYLRIYVNDELHITDVVKEKIFPPSLLESRLGEEKARKVRDFLRDYAAERNPARTGRFDAKAKLLEGGWNHVVVEIGNMESGCSFGSMDIEVNGMSVAGFPTSLLPSDDDVRNLLQPELYEDFSEATYSLCGRYIFQFKLD
jgi:hypothetical protein